MNYLIEILGPFKLSGIGTCLLCGSLIGLERQLSGKPAGIRTSILICFSTYVFASLSSFLVTDLGDPSRVVGQIVTGVGFLGGGVMLSRDGLVVGVTSAAVIWLLSAMGCLAAFGYEAQALVFTALTLFILVGVNLLERLVKKLNQGVHDKRKSLDERG